MRQHLFCLFFLSSQICNFQKNPLQLVCYHFLLQNCLSMKVVFPQTKIKIIQLLKSITNEKPYLIFVQLFILQIWDLQRTLGIWRFLLKKTVLSKPCIQNIINLVIQCKNGKIRKNVYMPFQSLKFWRKIAAAWCISCIARSEALKPLQLFQIGYFYMNILATNYFNR